MPRDAYYLPSRRLVQQDSAAIIQRANVPRSRFINQWSRLTTFDAGYLVPFMVDEMLPGDHHKYNVTAYLRMGTALFPMFSNQQISTFFFFCPARILWDNWTKFMGEQATPASSIAYTVPLIDLQASGNAAGSLVDHMGLPIAGQITAAEILHVNALPFRMYNRVYNDWFRDQNIINSVSQTTGDGPDSYSNYTLLKRAKAHDYFTSALPWPQKFTPLQTLFTGFAPIVGIGVSTIDAPTVGGINAVETGGATVNYPYAWDSTAAGNRFYLKSNAGAAGSPPQIFADLAQATGVTINALRQAWLIQDLLERDARGGTRYVELIRSHFGVTNPDFRLQRPEYIGGGTTPLNLTPIAQTTPTGGGGLGALGATGTAAGQHSASYAATEHGYVLALINVRSELHYQQGIKKLWNRSVRTDFYFPSLAGLGEQAILRKEIYATGVVADDDLVFGYQERWHDYRTHYSEVTGLFRSTSAGNIDEWHLAQHFSAPPTLSQAFIEDTPPMERILAAGVLDANKQYLADILINRTATRAVPTFGTPATLARF